jgi:hypothetical protein
VVSFFLSRGYNPQFAEHPNNGIAQIEFIPASGEVESVGVLMMVVLKGLAYKKDIPKKRITRLVARIVVPVSILMSTPVYKGSMDGTHKEMDG